MDAYLAIFIVLAILWLACAVLFVLLTFDEIFNAKDTDEGRPPNRRDANGGRSNPSPVPPVRRQDHSSHPPDLLENIHWDWIAPYGTVLSEPRDRERRHGR